MCDGPNILEPDSGLTGSRSPPMIGVSEGKTFLFRRQEPRDPWVKGRRSSFCPFVHIIFSNAVPPHFEYAYTWMRCQILDQPQHCHGSTSRRRLRQHIQNSCHIRALEWISALAPKLDHFPFPIRTLHSGIKAMPQDRARNGRQNSGGVDPHGRHLPIPSDIRAKPACLLVCLLVLTSGEWPGGQLAWFARQHGNQATLRPNKDLAKQTNYAPVYQATGPAFPPPLPTSFSQFGEFYEAEAKYQLAMPVIRFAMPVKASTRATGA